MSNKVLALAVLALTMNGCSSDTKPAEPASPAPAASPASPAPSASPAPASAPATGTQLDYGAGFFAPERRSDGTTFRWMGPEGVIRLRNTHREMALAIKGRAPAGLLPQKPMISLQLNGEPLDTVAATQAQLEKEFTIPSGRQGAGDWSELRITTSASYIPGEVKQGNSSDKRRLGFALYSVTWEPK